MFKYLGVEGILFDYDFTIVIIGDGSNNLIILKRIVFSYLDVGEYYKVQIITLRIVKS